MNEGIVDYGPEKILLLDFDERVVRSVERFAADNGFDDRMSARLYNVADALDEALLGQFGAFHINPPWGQYNGRSVVSFLRRGVQLVQHEGLGIVAIADDPSKEWAGRVLRETQKAAIDLGMITVEMQPSMHTYHLEDAPELASCAMTFRLIGDCAVPNRPLTADEKRDFYGRGQDLKARYVREIIHVGEGVADPRDYRIELQETQNA